jgi:hypothetical protein
MVLIDLATLYPEQADGKRSEPREVSTETEDSRSLSLSTEVTVLRGGDVSGNEQSGAMISGGAWIGIGLGVIALLAAITVTIWLMISRRREELSEELPSSMEFVTETDEELAKVCVRMDGSAELDDLGDGPPFGVGDAAGHVLEEAYL